VEITQIDLAQKFFVSYFDWPMKTLELEKNIFEPFHWSIIFSVASSCVWRLFLFATFDIGIDVFAGLESLFKTNHEVNTINNHLDQ